MLKNFFSVNAKYDQFYQKMLRKSNVLKEQVENEIAQDIVAKAPSDLGLYTH